MKCICKQKYQWPVRAVKLRGGFCSSQWMESENQLNGGVITYISQMLAVLRRLYYNPLLWAEREAVGRRSARVKHLGCKSINASRRSGADEATWLQSHVCRLQPWRRRLRPQTFLTWCARAPLSSRPGGRLLGRTRDKCLRVYSRVFCKTCFLRKMKRQSQDSHIYMVMCAALKSCHLWLDLQGGWGRCLYTHEHTHTHTLSLIREASEKTALCVNGGRFLSATAALRLRPSGALKRLSGRNVKWKLFC